MLVYELSFSTNLESASLKYVEVIANIIAVWLIWDSVQLLLEGLRFERQGKLLKRLDLSQREESSVTVVIAALNEADTIEPCLQSLQNQTLHSIEVILINDRSTDTTGKIMQKYCDSNSSWKYVEVETLPDGWLGKTHALHQGAAISESKYLLFTDADVLFAEDCIERAVKLADDENIAHLSLGPRFIAQSKLLQAMLLYFGILILRLLKPSKMHKRKNSYVGVGAFNLVKRKDYDELGGHKSLRLCVLDDIMLAKMFSKAGLKQKFVEAKEYLSIAWYSSVRKMIHGLQKNSFAALRYSWLKLLAIYIFNLSVHTIPYFLLFIVEGQAQLLLAAGLTSTHLLFALSAIKLGYSPLLSLLYAPAGLLLGWTQLRSGIVTTLKGSVSWRDTSYPVSTLKEFAQKNDL